MRQLRLALELVGDGMATLTGSTVMDSEFAPEVSAIIPCLDEETAIAAVVKSVRAHGVAEVIVVDGGSRDSTVETATAAGARVIVERQRGYGRAIQAGIRAAGPQSNVLLFLDGDGSDRTELVDRLKGPWGLQLHEGFLYFVEIERGQIVKYDLNGNLVEVVVSGLDSPQDLAFAADGAMIYADANGVHRRDVDGSTRTLAGGLGADLRGIALTSEGVYVADSTNNQLVKVVSVGGMDFGATDLAISTSGVLDLRQVYFNAPYRQLSLFADGIQGAMNTTVAAIAVTNIGETNADIVVNESDDIDVRIADWSESTLVTNCC